MTIATTTTQTAKFEDGIAIIGLDKIAREYTARIVKRILDGNDFDCTPIIVKSIEALEKIKEGFILPYMPIVFNISDAEESKKYLAAINRLKIIPIGYNKGDSSTLSDTAKKLELKIPLFDAVPLAVFSTEGETDESCQEKHAALFKFLSALMEEAY